MHSQHQQPQRALLRLLTVSLSLFFLTSSLAQATTAYIPANTTFDGGPEGWTQNTTLSDCSKGVMARKDNCLTTSHVPIGGSSDGFLRNNTKADANDVTDMYGVSTSTWDSPTIPLSIANNESVLKAAFKISLRAETIQAPGTPMATVANPFAGFRVTLVDRTLNKIVGFRYEYENYRSLPYGAIGSWQDYEWDFNDTEKSNLISGHEYFLRVTAVTTVYYQSLLVYNVHTDFDNAKVVITSGSTPPPPPTTTTTTTPPPTTTTPPLPPEDKHQQPQPINIDNPGGNDKPIEEPTGVPLDLSLNSCRIVDAYGAMNSFTVGKTKTRIWVRRTATTQVTSKRNYYVWTQIVRNKRSIRKVSYKLDGKTVKLDKRRRAVLRLQDFQNSTAIRHKLVATITPRKGKKKVLKLNVRTKPCTVLMQAGLKNARLELRVADWYPMTKVQFSLPKGINIMPVKAKKRNALRMLIGKRTIRFISTGKGQFKATDKSLKALKIKAKRRIITVTGLPEGTRDIRLLFQRNQRIVRIAWIKSKNRADTVLFKARVTDKITTRAAEYRAYNTNKRSQK